MLGATGAFSSSRRSAGPKPPACLDCVAGHRRAMLACEIENLPTLLGGQAAVDVVGSQGNPEGARPSREEFQRGHDLHRIRPAGVETTRPISADPPRKIDAIVLVLLMSDPVFAEDITRSSDRQTVFEPEHWVGA